MKNECGSSSAFLLDRIVQAGLLPVRKAGRLPLHEIRAHREVGSRKLQSVFQFLRHSGKKRVRLLQVHSESREERGSGAASGGRIG